MSSGRRGALTTLLAAAFFCLLTGGAAQAQTNPAAQALPFSLTSHSGGTLPNGVAAHRFGSIPTTRTTSPGTADIIYVTAGSSGGWRDEGANGISLLASGTQPAGAFVVAIDTTGKSNIQVSWVARTILQQASRDNSIALQYRVGTSGNFINLDPSVYTSAGKIAGDSAAFGPIALPAAAENQPVVQVRWIYWESVSTSNARDRIAIDEISITGDSTGQQTAPSGVGTAAPDTVLPGASTLLTVNVTPGTNPASTGIEVVADLSTIGGSSAQSFTDNGGNVFSFTATVPEGTAPGPRTLNVSITDDEGRSATTTIKLTVQSPPEPLNHVVISQVYGGSNTASSAYRHDFVELYNPTDQTFDLTGWSLQYASSTGSGWGGNTQTLAGPIGPGEYYLVRLAGGSAGASEVPLSNVEGSINMSGTTGKIALVENSLALTGSNAVCPLDDPELVDFVGYGTANCSEGGVPAAAPSASNATFRKLGGEVDTDHNGNDFETGAPNPRRTAIILDSPPSVASTDTDSEQGETTNAPRDASIMVFFSEPVEVIGTWYEVTCANSGTHPMTAARGPQNWVVTTETDFQPGEQCTFKILASQVRDADTDDGQPNTDFMLADYTRTFTVADGPAPPYAQNIHLVMGNPSGAAADTSVPNNYLMEKPEFSLSYNRDRGTPNWVSWHLSDEWTVFLPRVDTFRPDPLLPDGWYRVQHADYTNSGFDRGHVVPSADRLYSLPINQATFLMNNIVPQAPDNNRITWNNMEQDLRELLPANELYVVGGGAGIGGSGSNGGVTMTLADGKVTVPAVTWKVALVLPKGENDISRVDCSTRTIAVITPNTQGTSSDWTTYLTTVDAVETLTGYDFFSELPEPIQRCIEAGVNGVGNLPLDTDADGVPDSADNCDETANPNQADFDGDAQGDVCDADDDNDGTTDEAETAAGSDPLNANSTPETCDGVDNDLNEGVDEGFPDANNDGQANCVDTDDDGDGVSDSDETAAGSDPLDANSKPEVCDGVDNDLNQGVDEGFTNTDGDTQADCVDTDDDGDGFSDTAEAAAGSDPLNANSTPEVCDGVDNDLNQGVDEGFANSDGDNQADCVDPDDDNDGVNDVDDNCPNTLPGTTVGSTGCALAVTKDQCKNDGWKTLFRADGSPFKNQGDCIQFVNTEK